MRKFVAALVFLAMVTGVSYAEEPNGFRGIAWGTPLSAVSGMTLFENGEPRPLDYYRRRGDELKIGAANLTEISYRFWQGRLSGVIIMFNGLNFAPLKEATIQKFGQPFQPNRYIEDYVWSGKLTDATLSERGGWLVIDSVQMVKLEKQWDKQQTAAGAARGF